MLKYPKLRTKYLEISKDQESLSVVFPTSYLVIGLIAPEASPSVQDMINRVNLKPYEHACKQFSNSDYQYSEVDLNSAGERVFKNLLPLGSESTSAGTTLPVIVCYLEFNIF